MVLITTSQAHDNGAEEEGNLTQVKQFWNPCSLTALAGVVLLHFHSFIAATAVEKPAFLSCLWLPRKLMVGLWGKLKS